MAKNIKKVRGIKIFKKKHKKIQKLMEDNHYPEIHGDKVWFSSYFIMDYLDENPLEKNTRVLEIGCGWGLLGIYCAKKYQAKVTGVDADEHVFPFLELHAEENGVSIDTQVTRYEKIPESQLKEYDMVMGGDICFWDELVDPLYKLIQRSLKAGVGMLIIADPGRPPFLKLAKRLQKVHKQRAQLIPYCVIDPVEKDGYMLIIHNNN